MNATATRTLLEGFLSGGFDVFDALLSASFTHAAGDSSPLDAAALSDVLGTHPVVMKTSLKDGGTAALLFTMDDTTKIVSLTNGGDATSSDSLDDAGLGTLKEIADGVLGGGVAQLSEKFAAEIEMDSYEVQVLTAEQGDDLLKYIGDGPVLNAFSFTSDPDFDSSGFLIVSAALEKRVPTGKDKPLVSEDEMKDILSGFSPDDDSDAYGSGGESLPHNLELILGIDLTATARLGKIEMPISEILNIGPGSIIDVGHLVDDPVELLVNGRLIARGDVVVVDEKFGLRITEIISPKERIESLR